MEITADTPPEVAIKHAYDLGRALRSHGAREDQLRQNADLWIESRYRTHRLAPYLRAGFRAGYCKARLPSVGDVADGQPNPLGGGALASQRDLPGHRKTPKL